MMDELSASARSIIARYKEVESIPAAERARLLANILAACARGFVPKVDLSHPAPVMPRATLATRLWAAPFSKLLVAGAFLALPALAAVGFAQRENLPNIPAKPSVAAVAPEVTPPAVSALGLAEPALSPKPSAAPLDPAKRAAKPGSRPRDAGNGATIDGELGLLKQAQAANQAGDSRRALTLLDEYALRFPSGRLADVHAVARLVALCKLGQVSRVRQEAARFQIKYPNSPFSDRVQAICASKVGP